jgi:hypothetical protein
MDIDRLLFMTLPLAGRSEVRSREACRRKE